MMLGPELHTTTTKKLKVNMCVLEKAKEGKRQQCHELTNIPTNIHGSCGSDEKEVATNAIKILKALQTFSTKCQDVKVLSKDRK